MKVPGNTVGIVACVAGALVASAAADADSGASHCADSVLQVDHERIDELGKRGRDDVDDVSRLAVPLVFDGEAFAALKDRQSLRLTAFPLAPARPGEAIGEVTLDLTRSRSITDNSQFVSAGVDAGGRVVEQPMERPDLVMFSGKVVGDESSQVFLSFSPHGSHGLIRTGGVTQLISPGPYGGDHTQLIYNPDAIPPGMIRWRDFLCDTQTHDGHLWPGQIAVAGDGDDGRAAVPSGQNDGGPPCRRVEVAIETDEEFTEDLFGGDTEAAGAYVATLLGASSEIFEENINAHFEVVFVRLWTDSDPWTAPNTIDQLYEFGNYWNDNMEDVDRHLSHFLSGRELGGGVAFLDAVCHPVSGYALSANLSGFFPYPLEDNHPQNWDVMVVTHEFGHNFGTPHTHNFCPPLDECAPPEWFGGCQNEQNCISDGTIMGYCHLCDGGLENVVLAFHPVVQQTMLEYLDTVVDCDLECPPCATGDLNCDGAVTGEDLGILLSAWGPCADCEDCAADLTGDCAVSGEDLGVLLSNWTE